MCCVVAYQCVSWQSTCLTLPCEARVLSSVRARPESDFCLGARALADRKCQQNFPNRIPPRAPRGPASSNPEFLDERDVETLLGYKFTSCMSHQCLVRWRGGSAADDSWEKRAMFSENLHPYPEQFHELFGTDNIIFTP
ncbi:chromo (CHRromatin Organization MOdifier) domain protein [Puccinia sorghi]|uniref:Chromo (CHRromatin Organization MOdifier) domain protein n=1 Tax=Puccinia sorghi TaxID=27349 RepID=A0A0L6VAB4_9BASI|nr:chromo (CHRromatin Organization MOdifier) domain protein [Puccinia sorghi]